jgi:hypothetical protein
MSRDQRCIDLKRSDNRDREDYRRDLFRNGPHVDDFEELAKAVTEEQVVEWRLQHPPKLTDLTFRDAVRVYNAMSFAQWQFGPEGLMTSHVIILWATYGITDHQRAADLLGEYLATSVIR